MRRCCSFCSAGLNLYGNGIAGLSFGYPHSAGPWSVQPTLSLTVISFFNVLKYPPSLDYLLVTLGPALILLGLLDGAKAARGLSRILMVFGRVPLFYYVLHIYLIHILAILVALAFHQPIWHGTVIADFAQKPLGMVMVCRSFTPCGFWRWQFFTALSVVHGTPQPASRLGLAKLLVRGGVHDGSVISRLHRNPERNFDLPRRVGVIT